MVFNLHNVLPENYTVGPNDVIIGRGKKCTQNPGNKRFRSIIQATLDAYSNALTKVQKSEIIMHILSLVRADNGVGFVKQDAATGRFTQVEEAASRIAIAQAFRDALSGLYKSSKKHKQTRRLQRKESQELLKKVKDVVTMPQNDDMNLDVASRICNSYLLSQTDQLISFAFHESNTVIEATKEAKELDMLVTTLFLD